MPARSARISSIVKQFAKLNIQLEVRDSDYNRFQDKMRKGTAQLFFWGWLADYPDPENFLFMLYGPNAKAKTDGENAANYSKPSSRKSTPSTLSCRPRRFSNRSWRQPKNQRNL